MFRIADGVSALEPGCCAGLHWRLLDVPVAGTAPCETGLAHAHGSQEHEDDACKGRLQAVGPPVLLAPGVPRNYHLASQAELGIPIA